MPAMDALHLKKILHDDLTANRAMMDYLDAYIRSVRGDADTRRHQQRIAREIGEGVPVAAPEMFAPEEEGAHLALRLSKWMDAAYTYYVDPKMHALITAASESMPQEHLKVGDLPTDYGFMLIPGGIGVIDIRGRLLKYNAVLWTSFGGKVDIYWFTDKTDMEDSGNFLMNKQMKSSDLMALPRLTLNQKTYMHYGKSLPSTPGPDYIVPPEVKMDITRHDNPDGSTSLAWFVQDNGMTPQELQQMMQLGVRTDPALRWLLTTWRLMQQTITSVTEEEAPRQLRRQLERKNLDTKVTVIALRNKAARGDGGTEVEWSHQWLVRGHWRNQPCKDEEGNPTTRLVWIHPYIKGPEDKPLLVREHVYSLQR